MFNNFSNNISKVFDKISGKKFVGEGDLDETLREIRVALLEADVSLVVAKDFIEKVRDRANGEQVIKSVTAGQMIVKIVNDCLVELLGSEKSEINLEVKPPVVILMAGLQGAGKTTSAAKLGLKLKSKHGKKVLVASLDAYRPAAKEQLEQKRKATNQNNILTLAINDKRALIHQAKDSVHSLTLAARNEEEMSESDINGVLQDLIDLGVIDEDGNIK